MCAGVNTRDESRAGDNGEHALDELLAQLTPEQKRRLLERLEAERPKRQRKTISPEVQTLLEERERLRQQLREVNNKLKELGVRRGTPTPEEFLEMPLGQAVVEILREHGQLTIEQLEEELSRRNYKLSGSAMRVLTALRQKGLLEKRNGILVYKGE